MDTDTHQWQAFENPGINHSGGAGVAAAQFVIDQHADVVISGDFGPNAANAFRAAKIKMHLFSSEVSTVQQAVDTFMQGNLPAFA
jgi:predicted Fe-Mo cluster-binding NifX family protein